MSLLSPLIQMMVMRHLEDDDRANIASTCRYIAFQSQAEVFSELYVYIFGEPIVEVGSKRSSSRRSTSPRCSYFKALREVPKKWHFLLMSLHKKDYAKEKFRALMNRWRFPCPHSYSTLTLGKVQLSAYQHRVLNDCHAAFEHAPLLCVAARFSKWGAVRTLLEDYSANPTVTDARGMNILIMAAWSGKLHVVKFIFSHCQEEQLVKLMSAKGVPHMTSACGGKGPFNAYTWARRKAAHCINDQHQKVGMHFKKIANFMQQKAESIFMHSSLNLANQPTLEMERVFLEEAMAVYDIQASYLSLLKILNNEVPIALRNAISDHDKLVRRAGELKETLK